MYGLRGLCTLGAKERGRTFRHFQIIPVLFFLDCGDYFRIVEA